ncbi:hypothetical protein [Streptomyces longwoodensis]|uniref:hypothetical protein n=1 Tax=Streptomyces longwoodensis TaxID=68231 RepID=UPI002F907C01
MALLKIATVAGRTDFGVMSSGQAAGLIDDLPSCAKLIERSIAGDRAGLRLSTLPEPPLKMAPDLRTSHDQQAGMGLPLTSWALSLPY